MRTQFVLAYLPIANLSNALMACLNADCIRMDESVLYWEFVTPEIAKFQKPYITGELLAIMGTKADQLRYHMVKWDEYHQAFLVLFASNFIAEIVTGVRLAPNWEFFKSHMTGLLEQQRVCVALVSGSGDTKRAIVSNGYWTFMYYAKNESIETKFLESMLPRMWKDNSHVFQWVRDRQIEASWGSLG